VTVGVTTTGADIDNLVFRVDIAPAGAGGPVRADAGVFTARNVPAGEHVVRLTGLPDRCRVDGGADRAITVSDRRSAVVRFVVDCGSARRFRTELPGEGRDTGSGDPR
jgi:hypothetical protein